MRGRVLDPPWGSLWALFRWLWEVIWVPWGHQWGLLDPLWPLFGVSGPLGYPWVSLGVSVVSFSLLWDGFGVSLGIPLVFFSLLGAAI